MRKGPYIACLSGPFLLTLPVRDQWVAPCGALKGSKGEHFSKGKQTLGQLPQETKTEEHKAFKSAELCVFDGIRNSHRCLIPFLFFMCSSFALVSALYIYSRYIYSIYTYSIYIYSVYTYIPYTYIWNSAMPVRYFAAGAGGGWGGKVFEARLQTKHWKQWTVLTLWDLLGCEDGRESL